MNEWMDKAIWRGEFPYFKMIQIRSFSFFSKLNYSLVALLVGGLSESLLAQSYVKRGDTPLYTQFLDPTAPFLETTLDLRTTGSSEFADNLVPRALVLALGEEFYVGFDTELLRVAAIWSGESISLGGLAVNSYGSPRRKAPPGQAGLVQPAGEIALKTGLYPGWLDHSQTTFLDPRSRWVDENELGRGPLSREMGRWAGVEDYGSSVALRYTLMGGTVEERFRLVRSAAETTVERRIRLEGLSESLILVLADFSSDAEIARTVAEHSEGVSLVDDRYLVAELTSRGEFLDTVVRYRLSPTGGFIGVGVDSVPSNEAERAAEKTAARWPEEQSMGFEEANAQGSFSTQRLELAYPNLWQRRIRPVDIVFDETGVAFLLTFDGDVYRIEGISSKRSSWRRIAAGFNEPQSLEMREGALFVFSRLGVTRLVDRDGDGETDFYEMFCNDFTQSAETRDMPMSLTALEDGSFLICKGGQQVDAKSPHSGRVLRIARDGSKVEVYATGLRNGYLELQPGSGLITASDQQGNWVPSTPLLVVEEGGYYGFELSLDENNSVSEPILWIPHRISQSGIGQIWAFDERLGSLNGSMIWIDYQGPRLLEILFDDQALKDQAVALPLPIDFEVPLLNGAINPVDGNLYLVGFQIWGTNAERYEGIVRLSVAKSKDELPQRALGFKEGILLEFSEPIASEHCFDPGNYLTKSWEYLRTGAYGSAQYKGDGSFGEDEWTIHSTLLSKDGKSVFLAIENLVPTMQFGLEYNLFGRWDSAYFTFNRLDSFDARSEGFGEVDFGALFASPMAERTVRKAPAIVSAKRGRELYEQFACMGCHSLDGSTEGKIGPTFKDLYWKDRLLSDGSTTVANDSYLRWSIMKPEADIVAGYDGDDASMPSYRGILNRDDIDSIILFIRTLSEEK